MTSPTVAGSSLVRLRQTVSYGNSPPSDIAPHGHADGGPFFHPAGDNDNESSALRVNQTQLSRSLEQRGDCLVNFAEDILFGAGLALMASEDLLNRTTHLLVSLQNKNATDAEYQHAETTRESSNVFFT